MTTPENRVCLLNEPVAPVAIHTQDVDYLHVNGESFHATIYQPEGTGPFPLVVDVHGGAWVRNDICRDEHALMDKALAAMGMVVVAIDFRQSSQHHYPDSVADVNFAFRWARVNAPKFNASSQCIGAFGSSSGGHLVLLNSMRPGDSRYTTHPLAGAPLESARPDYIILAYPISDPYARLAYAQVVENHAVVKATNIYFAPPESIQDGNPQHILDRREPVKLPPALLLQGSAAANGIVEDKNVSPEIQQQFVAAYEAAGGKIQFELLPGAPHNFINTVSANFDHALALMKNFIRQQVNA